MGYTTEQWITKINLITNTLFLQDLMSLFYSQMCAYKVPAWPLVSVYAEILTRIELHARSRSLYVQYPCKR